MNLDKLLKIGIAAGIFLVGLSIFYYLVIFQPARQREASQQAAQKTQAENAKSDLDMEAKCRKSGEELYQQEKAHNASIGLLPNATYGPQYHYNASSHLCLYAAWHFDRWPSGQSYPDYRVVIENGFTGEVIYVYVQNGSDPKDVIDKKQAEFNKQWTGLFESPLF